MKQTLIEGIPKAELHVHLEGTLEPKMMLEMAARNGIDVPYDGMNIYSAYNFQNLSSFLKLYYGGLEVLCTEEDFFDLTKAYMDRIHLDNVKHTEIFFNPQNHVKRGISFETVFNGIERALCESDISSYLILDFNRTFSIESAFEILEEAVNYQHRIVGVGLDGIEEGQYREYLQKKYYGEESGLGRNYDEYKNELGEIMGNGQLSDKQESTLKKLDEYVQGLVGEC